MNRLPDQWIKCPRRKIVVLLFSLAGLANAQNRPCSQKEIEDHFLARPVASAIVLKNICDRGVDFYLTADVERQLREKGATQEMIDAIKKHGPPDKQYGGPAVKREDPAAKQDSPVVKKDAPPTKQPDLPEKETFRKACVYDPISNVRAAKSDKSEILCSIKTPTTIHITAGPFDIGQGKRWWATDVCGQPGYIANNQIHIDETCP